MNEKGRTRSGVGDSTNPQYRQVGDSTNPQYRKVGESTNLRQTRGARGETLSREGGVL